MLITVGTLVVALTALSVAFEATGTAVVAGALAFGMFLVAVH